MKYITKELRREGPYLPIELPEASERAACFSEEFFRELYDKKLWDDVEGMRRSHETSKEKSGKSEFNEKQHAKFFQWSVEHTLRYITEDLPEELISQVADPRVMALYVVAPGMKQEVRKYDVDFSKGLTEAPEAAVFSEAYYQKLYAEKLEERLQFSRKASGIFSELTKKIFDEPFDEETWIRDFAERFERELKATRKTWPPELLEKVADPRVLVLGVATPEVRHLIEGMKVEEKERGKRSQEAFKAYRKLHKELLRRHPGSFLNAFDFHDARIRELRWQDGDFVVEFGEGIVRTEIVRVIFRNTEILTMDEKMEDSDWLYAEVYEHGSRFEIHILVYRYDGALEEPHGELTLLADDVEYEYRELQ